MSRPPESDLQGQRIFGFWKRWDDPPPALGMALSEKSTYRKSWYIPKILQFFHSISRLPTPE